MAQGLIRSDKSRDGIAAVLAVNLANLEDQMAERQEQWAAEEATFAGMQAALEEGGLRVLNGPNLLAKHQPLAASVSVPDGAVVYDKHTVAAEAQGGAATTYTITDENITAAMEKLQAVCSNWDCLGNGTITVTCSAGSAVVSLPARSAHSSSFTVEIWICEKTTATLPYGEASRCYMTGEPYLDSIKNGSYPGDMGDEISESVVTLTGTDIIEEQDGTSYTKAVEFTVTNPPSNGWGNADKIIFGYGNHGSGTQPVPVSQNTGEPYGDLPMTVGHRYTLSCWARITSGTKALIWFGASAARGQHVKVPNGYGTVEIDAKGGAWQRVVFEFVFSPTGDHFNVASGVQTPNWTKTVGVGVCRKYAGTVQLAGFRLVDGKMWVSETYDDLDERLTALEDAVAALGLAAGQSF